MNNELTAIETEQHLFTEEDVLLQYEEASTGQRILNFIIDSLVIRFTLAYAVGAVLGLLFYAISEDFYRTVFFNENTSMTYLINYIVGSFIYIIYYTFCEKVFNGVTLGKLITGSKALSEEGHPLTFKQALLRSLSRVVPFETLSAIWGAPWHDTWTKTMVIKTR